ncbi:MAG: transcriptional regulator [Bacilli bacterium]|nr:transcriptional regulator [Bacilli bacterium]
MMKLTKRQKIILEAIDYFIQENGYSPTYNEIANLIGANNISSIFGICLKLEIKGYISTEKGKSRTIRILKTI